LPLNDVVLKVFILMPVEGKCPCSQRASFQRENNNVGENRQHIKMGGFYLNKITVAGGRE